LEADASSFSGYGEANGERIVEARFTLRHFNLADRDPAMATVDKNVIESMRQRWRLLNNE